jgi:hypothetical protein
MLWGVIVCLAMLCVALFVDGRRREQAVLRDWELALTPRAKQTLAAAREQISAELDVIDLMYDGAQEHREEGRTAEAIRLLDEGCRLIEGYCPTMLRSVAALSVLSRMAAAMAPPRPLRRRDFQLRQLEGLALLNQFVHQFLVSTGERFRIRLYFLARGFSTLVRIVAGARRRVHEVRSPEPEWRQLTAARHDVRSLSDEWLESFRLLLMSLAAERRA